MSAHQLFMTTKKELGDLGERLAAKFLIKKGFELLAHNVQCNEGELDLVMQKNGIYHLVEVKTRSSDVMGHGEEAIDDDKIDRIMTATEHYFFDVLGLSDFPEFQIDAVIVKKRGEKFFAEYWPEVTG